MNLELEHGFGRSLFDSVGSRFRLIFRIYTMYRSTYYIFKNKNNTLYLYFLKLKMLPSIAWIFLSFRIYLIFHFLLRKHRIFIIYSTSIHLRIPWSFSIFKPICCIIGFIYSVIIYLLFLVNIRAFLTLVVDIYIDYGILQWLFLQIILLLLLLLKYLILL